MGDDTDNQKNEPDEISSRFLLALLLVVSFGFSAHRLRPVIKSMGLAWSELTSYAVGGVMIIAVFPMLYSMVLDSAGLDHAAKKPSVFLAFVSLVLAFGATGAGVALGWLVDPDAEDE